MTPEINAHFSPHNYFVLSLSSHCIPEFSICSRPLETINFPPVLENPSVRPHMAR